MFNQFDNAQLHISDIQADAKHLARATAARHRTTPATIGKTRFAAFSSLFSHKPAAI